MSKKITIHDALIYVMVMASAVDAQMPDSELARIGRLTRFLPVFAGFNSRSPDRNITGLCKPVERA